MTKGLLAKYSRDIIMVVSGVWFAFSTLKKDSELNNVQKEKGKLQEEVATVRESIVQLVYTVSNSSADMSIIPIPIWYKIYDRADDTFNMVFINDAFEKKYNVSREKYIGENDKIVWGDSLAKIFYENDKRAFWSRNPVWALEPDRTGRLFPVLKWRVDKGDRIFIYGMELPDEIFIGKYGYKVPE